MDDRLMTTDEVAATLKQCKRTLYKNLSMGRMPEPVRIGRSVRWRASDIQGYIAAGCDMTAYSAAR